MMYSDPYLRPRYEAIDGLRSQGDTSRASESELAAVGIIRHHGNLVHVKDAFVPVKDFAYQNSEVDDDDNGFDSDLEAAFANPRTVNLRHKIISRPVDFN